MCFRVNASVFKVQFYNAKFSLKVHVHNADFWSPKSCFQRGKGLRKKELFFVFCFFGFFFGGGSVISFWNAKVLQAAS